MKKDSGLAQYERHIKRKSEDHVYTDVYLSSWSSEKIHAHDMSRFNVQVGELQGKGKQKL